MLPCFSDQDAYIAHLSKSSALPKGFSVGTASGTFVSSEAPAMGKLPIRATIVYLPEGPVSTWTAVFTKNKLPGAPVKIGKERVSNSNKLQAIVINNKISNVCSETGISDSTEICKAVANNLNLSLGENSVLPCSTGIIGWRLPVRELSEEIIPEAIKNMNSCDALDMGQAIMTTDRYPKLRSATLSSGAKIVGVAKGAGMVEPNMATMLCYILSDAQLPSDSSLNDMLQSAIDASFNCISIDSDESTSDTAVLLTSSKISSNAAEFSSALKDICINLAKDVVRNGEGTSHVIQVTVQNYSPSLNSAEAKLVGKQIINSPLFKCAVCGNDPNIGRLASAIGSYLGKLNKEVDIKDMTITLGGNLIFSNGRFNLDAEMETFLSNYMQDAAFGECDAFPIHQKSVEVIVDFGYDEGDKEEKVVVWGSDLSAEYVSVNSDYRS